MRAAGGQNTKYWMCATPVQMRLLEEACKGKIILDLGGRDGSLALHLLATGAKGATNVDHDGTGTRLKGAHLGHFRGTYAKFDAKNPNRRWDVGILSWPVIYSTMLDPVMPILDRCEKVIYLGKNSYANQCGTRRLWRYLVRRQMEASIERKEAALLIYGGIGRTTRQTEEEYWGLKAIPH